LQTQNIISSDGCLIWSVVC